MIQYDSSKDIHEGTTDDGEKVISCDLISYGDYDNSCAVERANVRYLQENKLNFITEHGGYGSVKIWLLDTEENRELLEEIIFNYPCFDDELVSQVEMEIEEEYIKDNDDLYRLCAGEELKDILCDLDLRSIDMECYYKARDESNTEFIVESGGIGYIDMKRLAPAYFKALRDKYPAIEIIQDLRAQVENRKTAFPLDFYDSARDMLQHCQTTGRAITSDEAMEILKYAAELEGD